VKNENNGKLARSLLISIHGAVFLAAYIIRLSSLVPIYFDIFLVFLFVH
jgi:hypothetical protein